MNPNQRNSPNLDNEGLFTHHLLAVGKLKYAKGQRPKISCIFCGVRDNNPAITSLKVFQDEYLMVCLNLYPYNPGHLMVIPTKHVEKFEDLTENERNYLFWMVIQMQKMLQDIFSPTGFNVGYNQGNYAGASIQHVHVHIVPRYREELGFIDIIGTTKVIVEPLSEVLQKIQKYIGNYINTK
ncbi:MAG: HIT family hydrolase [Promethearchaeia archaeon]|nr:MAG: HIT family hydrolase [Candidatus Lokiarchaeia archaeon]